MNFPKRLGADLLHFFPAMLASVVGSFPPAGDKDSKAMPLKAPSISGAKRPQNAVAALRPSPALMSMSLRKDSLISRRFKVCNDVTMACSFPAGAAACLPRPRRPLTPMACAL